MLAMNYDEIVNQIMKGEKIQNLPLFVTYYCRVSTDSDVQINSLENQLSYYEKYIKSNYNWTFIDGYVEEGVTGVRVDKRPIFQKMINDAKLHKFNLIITKEASRFARDLEDSVHYIRELKKYGVGIFFENQNLNTFDYNSELILNIMFNLAQEESKKLSSRIKFGHNRAIEKGHVLGSSNIIGYKKNNCKLEIVEEEAEIIKKIFELYASGEYGLGKLSHKLFVLGYHNKKGNMYDKDTLKRIIENPKYKGFYRAHTYEIMDYRTKRRIKITKDKQVLYKCDKDIIPPIINEELWNKANKILNKRMNNYKKNNHYSGGLKYPLSSKIICNEHNTSFQHKRKNIWCCSKYLKFGVKGCLSPLVDENDINDILKIIINSFNIDSLSFTSFLLDLYSNIENNKINDEIRAIDDKVYKLENKKDILLDYFVDGSLNKKMFENQIEKIENEIKNMKNRKDNIISILNVEELSKIIKNEYDSNLLSCFIKLFLEKIIVSKNLNDRKIVKFDIFLNIIDDNRQTYTMYLENQKYNAKKYYYNVYINCQNGSNF